MDVERHCLSSLGDFNKLGLPLKTSTYDNNGVLTSTSENNYETPPYYYEGSVIDQTYHVEGFSIRECPGVNGTFVNYTHLYSSIFDFAKKYKISSVQNISYENGLSLTTNKTYTYDSHNNVSSISVTDSKNDVYATYYTYAYGFNNNMGIVAQNYVNALGNLTTSQLQFPIYSITWKNPTTDQRLVKMSMVAPDQNYVYGNPVRFPYSFTSVIDAPIPYQSLPNSLSDILINKKSVNKYDSKNNVLEECVDNCQHYNAYVWDTRIGQKVATIANAHYNEIAYTSFEGPFAAFGVADDNKGNWDFDPAQISLATAGIANKPATGRYYYNLSSLLSGAYVSLGNPLAAGKSYTISMWATGQPFVSCAAGGGTIPVVAQQQVNGWTLYTAAFTTTTTGGLTVSGPQAGTIKLDELRLYPSDATMSTVSYEPLLGPNSVCDERNNILYYEYDIMGRPTLVRDINGNVLSKTMHVIQGNDN